MSKHYGYLINPFDRTITEVPYNGDFHHIYEHIQAECFDLVRVNEQGDGVFVDDEGLIKEGPTAFFHIKGYPNPLAGRGLYLGCDHGGDSVSPYATLEEVRNSVEWVTPIRINGQIVWMTAVEIE